VNPNLDSVKRKTQVQISPNFVVDVAVEQDSSGSVAKCGVFPVWWITSCISTVPLMAQAAKVKQGAMLVN